MFFKIIIAMLVMVAGVFAESELPRNVQREMDRLNSAVEDAFIEFSKKVEKARADAIDAIKKQQPRIRDTDELLATVTALKDLEGTDAVTILKQHLGGSSSVASATGGTGTVIDVTDPAELAKYFATTGSHRVENGALRITGGGRLLSNSSLPESFTIRVYSGKVYESNHPVDDGTFYVHGAPIWRGKWTDLARANNGEATEWVEIAYNAQTTQYQMVNNKGIQLASGTAAPAAGHVAFMIQDNGGMPYGSNIRAIEIARASR